MNGFWVIAAILAVIGLAPTMSPAAWLDGLRKLFSKGNVPGVPTPAVVSGGVPISVTVNCRREDVASYLEQLRFISATLPMPDRSDAFEYCDGLDDVFNRKWGNKPAVQAVVPLSAPAV